MFCRSCLCIIFSSTVSIFSSSDTEAIVFGGTAVLVDDLQPIAYHSPMTNDETDNLPIDPLTVGELISLEEAAKYAGLTRKSLRNYALKGRLRAKKLGSQWVTTHAAVDAYVASRSVENIPRKYRRSS